MKIVTSIFLERSIVFVSKSPAKLSSVILGLHSLISPFSWCHTLIPVLPANLWEILDTPIPILVGLTHKSFKYLELDTDLIQSKTWVYLDNQSHSNDIIRISTPELISTGIDWCQNEEAISYEEQLWYMEYPGFNNLMDLHQSLISDSDTDRIEDQCLQTKDESIIYHLSDV
jgi:hypothetical protein